MLEEHGAVTILGSTPVKCPFQEQKLEFFRSEASGRVTISYFRDGNGTRLDSDGCERRPPCVSVGFECGSK